MYGLKPIDNRNYRSLLIAGLGTIGKGLITLGADQLSFFEHVYLIDKNADTLQSMQASGFTCLAGDIRNPLFLNTLMADVPGPSLFVNLCSGTNNVRIRNNLALHDTAYLDSCASTTQNPGECRFSRLMPYTYTEIDTSYPHWLCWGINPGLVEIMVRRILRDMPYQPRAYDVAVYEFDRLQNVSDTVRVAVGWCPEALVEEVMLSPTLEVINGMLREGSGPGTQDSVVNWENNAVGARIVGHEDIWNLIEIPAVKNGRFYYSLSPAVMSILNMNDADRARDMLDIPGEDDIISAFKKFEAKAVF
ncbi:MAG: hypothetical protein ACWGN1_05160, partial [Desulfobulbales bacterium]